MQEHCAAKVAGGAPSHTLLSIANLDPAAEHFEYEPVFDIRDLISVEEVMEELGLGPNGALLYCMEYLLHDHLDWLREELEQFGDDDYVLLDCPGQIELYTHVPVQKQILEAVAGWGHAGRMVSVFCIDAGFCCDASKFISGTLLSLSSMIALELPHVTILTKCDLLKEEELEKILSYGSATHLWDTEQDRQSLLTAAATTSTTNRNDMSLPGRSSREDNNENLDEEARILRNRLSMLETRRRHRERLTTSISQLLDDWQMVSFVPLDWRDEDGIENVLLTINNCIQYGEDLDVRGADLTDDIPNENDDG
jgi:hypothetical protein